MRPTMVYRGTGLAVAIGFCLILGGLARAEERIVELPGQGEFVANSGTSIRTHGRPRAQGHRLVVKHARRGILQGSEAPAISPAPVVSVSRRVEHSAPTMSTPALAMKPAPSIPSEKLTVLGPRHLQSEVAVTHQKPRSLMEVLGGFRSNRGSVIVGETVIVHEAAPGPISSAPVVAAPASSTSRSGDFWLVAEGKAKTRAENTVVTPSQNREPTPGGVSVTSPNHHPVEAQPSEIVTSAMAPASKPTCLFDVLGLTRQGKFQGAHGEVVLMRQPGSALEGISWTTLPTSISPTVVNHAPPSESVIANAADTPVESAPRKRQPPAIPGLTPAQPSAKPAQATTGGQAQAPQSAPATAALAHSAPAAQAPAQSTPGNGHCNGKTPPKPRGLLRRLSCPPFLKIEPLHDGQEWCAMPTTTMPASAAASHPNDQTRTPAPTRSDAPAAQTTSPAAKASAPAPKTAPAAKPRPLNLLPAPKEKPAPKPLAPLTPTTAASQKNHDATAPVVADDGGVVLSRQVRIIEERPLTNDPAILRALASGGAQRSEIPTTPKPTRVEKTAVAETTNTSEPESDLVLIPVVTSPKQFPASPARLQKTSPAPRQVSTGAVAATPTTRAITVVSSSPVGDEVLTAGSGSPSVVNAIPVAAPRRATTVRSATVQSSAHRETKPVAVARSITEKPWPKRGLIKVGPSYYYEDTQETDHYSPAPRLQPLR